MEKLVIIDGNSLINRAFYALPMLSNKDGEFSNAVYGFTNMLIKTIEEYSPDYIVVAFDYGRKTFRNELYAEYKGTRKETPAELKSQFPILKQFLAAMGIKMFERNGIEADDIIGAISARTNVNTIILSGDRDVLQLIDDTTQVWLTKKGISEVEIVDEKQLKEKYSLTPKQVIELKALMGDSSDNIPGVPGVGEKTAHLLLNEYENIENIYKNIDKITGKLQEKLISGKEMAFLSKKLATINTNIDIEFNIADFKYDYPFKEEVFELFRKYEFNSLLKKYNVSGIKEPEKVRAKVKEINIQKISDFQKVNVTPSEMAIIVGSDISVAFDKKTVYNFNLQHSLLEEAIEPSDIFDIFKKHLEDNRVKKIIYDAKGLMHKLSGFGIKLQGLDFDVKLAAYLVNAGERTPELTTLFSLYNCSEQSGAANLFILKNELKTEMEKFNLIPLFNEIEMPLINVLFDMEERGFKIDKKVLEELSLRYGEELEDLSKVIKTLAGEDFNINSPKQLGDILFNKLHLSAYNNKKNSTSVDVLMDIQHKHPIVPLILRYRKIQKLSTTYLESFKILLIGEDKIKTIFNQTLTATGRLSSSEPNLQNIPVRDDEGKVLRKMFVSSFENGYIVSADYSQIELRLLAHYSEDPGLIEAYQKGYDIHTITASEVFGVSKQEVTSQMRRDAKAVNFGIIYGISDYGLSQNIGSSRAEAKKYIETYFERYPKVKEFMNRSVEIVKEKGYITTLFGRIRKIKEVFSPNYNTRQFGERVSMNMPLQGTASDIIKLAMTRVYNRLKAENLQSKLILQVHDELIIDTEKDEASKVIKILKEEMEGAINLKVPLIVDVNMGNNWYECK